MGVKEDALAEANAIILSGVLDEEAVEETIAALKLLDSRAVGKARELRPPYIQLVISSPGGDMPAAFAISDFVQMLETPVFTLALGLCFSAATLVAAAGAKGHRHAAPNTLFLFHPPVGGRYGTVDEVEAYSRALKREVEQWAKRMAQYAAPEGEPPSEELVQKMLELHSSDNWLRPDEVLELGIIDNIYEPSAAKQYGAKAVSLLEEMDAARGEGAIKMLEAYGNLSEEELAELVHKIAGAEKSKKRRRGKK